jgi:hypothetical protein
MPKGTTPHYHKKNSSSNEAWRRTKTERNATDTGGKLIQRNWRAACLETRRAANKLTDKNQKEMEKLDIGKSIRLESERSERT